MPARRRALCSSPVLLVASLSLAGIAGCGAEIYQQRLDNTKKLFAHLEQLNAHLHQYWGDPQTGVKLRIPLQFSMIPPPVPTKSAGDDGQPAEPEPAIDDRQPKFLNVELPGLRGAFFAKMNLVDPSATAVDPYGFIYVLTNHHLYDMPDKAREFHVDLVSTLSDTLRTGVKPDDWREEKFPLKVGTFAETVRYKSVVLSPSEMVGGLERQFSVYMFDQGDVRVAILFVLPKDINASEKMTDRMPLCLETLRVQGDKLVAPSVAPVGSASGTSF